MNGQESLLGTEDDMTKEQNVRFMEHVMLI